MKKYEVTVEDESSALLTALLETLPYVKEVKRSDTVSAFTLVSEESLGEDWLAEEDDELQRMYKQ